MLAVSGAVFLMGAAPPIEVHGHRGARSVLPENTIPAFEHAIEAGADFIELDLAVTRDDVLVVSHDPTLNRAICRSPGGGDVIRQLTLAEVKRWDCGSLRNAEFPDQKPVPGAKIPTLDETLALASRGHFRFNIEIKSFPDKPDLTPPPGEFARLVVEMVRERELEERVQIQSFDFRILHAVREIAPEIRLAALYGSGPLDFAAIAREAGAPVVCPHFALVTPEKVKAAHDAGLRVIPWTANSEETWEKLIAAGVDGIITDDPAALIHYLKARKLR
ncbi:MAG: glycerophosphodiester phosphodiesterase [Bryobacteraceae bacterium]|nr:glycerophosphodiester phosphodiesterase [Bryobacteraceae bacterium]